MRIVSHRAARPTLSGAPEMSRLSPLGGIMLTLGKTMKTPTQEQVAAAITKLRPSLRAIFVMAYVQGRSRQEIAATLGISKSRVDRRMTKALSSCRAHLNLD